MDYQDVIKLLELPSTLASQGDNLPSNDGYMWEIQAKSGASEGAIEGPFYFGDLFEFAKLVAGNVINEYGPSHSSKSDPAKGPKVGEGSLMIKQIIEDGVGGDLEDYEARIVRVSRTVATKPIVRFDNQEFQIDNEKTLRRSEPIKYPVGP